MCEHARAEGGESGDGPGEQIAGCSPALRCQPRCFPSRCPPALPPAPPRTMLLAGLFLALCAPSLCPAVLGAARPQLLVERSGPRMLREVRGTGPASLPRGEGTWGGREGAAGNPQTPPRLGDRAAASGSASARLPAERNVSVAASLRPEPGGLLSLGSIPPLCAPSRRAALVPTHGTDTHRLECVGNSGSFGEPLRDFHVMRRERSLFGIPEKPMSLGGEGQQVGWGAEKQQDGLCTAARTHAAPFPSRGASLPADPRVGRSGGSGLLQKWGCAAAPCPGLPCTQTAWAAVPLGQQVCSGAHGLTRTHGLRKSYSLTGTYSHHQFQGSRSQTCSGCTARASSHLSPD